MPVYRKFAKFNGEYGFDEPSIIVPPSVTDTYDHDDDEDEEEIVCDPNVDYECDGDMLDNYDGWYFDEENFDVFKLKELIDALKEEFELSKDEYNRVRDKIVESEIVEYGDEMVTNIENDIRNLESYMNDPMVFSNDIDMHIMLNALGYMGTIPNLLALKQVIALDDTDDNSNKENTEK